MVKGNQEASKQCIQGYGDVKSNKLKGRVGNCY